MWPFQPTSPGTPSALSLPSGQDSQGAPGEDSFLSETALPTQSEHVAARAPRVHTTRFCPRHLQTSRGRPELRASAALTKLWGSIDQNTRLSPGLPRCFHGRRSLSVPGPLDVVGVGLTLLPLGFVRTPPGICQNIPGACSDKNRFKRSPPMSPFPPVSPSGAL